MSGTGVTDISPDGTICSACLGYNGPDFFSRLCKYHSFWSIPYDQGIRENRKTIFSISPYKHYMDIHFKTNPKDNERCKIIIIDACAFVCGAD